MNSQFRNSNFGFALYTIIIVIMLLATGFVVWYMTIGYRVGTFGPDTRLGNVYIGGLTEDRIVPLMDERITYWYNDETIVFELVYQDYTYEFDRDYLLFDLELSTFDLSDGITNVLLVQYQTGDLATIQAEIRALPFLARVKDNIDYTALISAILYDASLMKTYSSQNIEDYFIEPNMHVDTLHSTSFRVPDGVNIDDVIAIIDGKYDEGHIPVQSKALFDVLTILGNDLDDQELTMLTPAMMESVLHTNFVINEVHYDSDIDFTLYNLNTYPYFGRNAVINRIVQEGFSFYNPNELSYYFSITKTDEDNGVLTLHGVPFEYDISVIVDVQPIDYVTETTNNVVLLQQGHDGAIVEVQRVIIDVYGETLSDSIIVFEFYPPIKELIFQP